MLLALLQVHITLASSNVEQSLATAETARANGQLQVAHHLLLALLHESPQHEAVNLAYGLTVLEMGDASRAEMAFQRVLQQNPQHHRARLELARALAALGRHEEAAAELRVVLDTRRLPPAVRANVEAYLAILQSKSKQQRPIQFNIEAGVLYDTNVNVGPDSDLIAIRPVFFGPFIMDRLRISEGSKARKDYGFFVAGRGRYQFAPTAASGWLTELGLHAYLNRFAEENDYALVYYQAHAALVRQRESYRIQIPIHYAQVHRGGERLLQTIGLSPSHIYLMPNAGKRIVIGGNAEWRDYTDNDDRDGLSVLASVGIDQLVGARRHLVGLSFAFLQDFADAKIYQKYGVRIGLHSTLRLPWQSSIHTGASYTEEFYREQEVLAPERREDTLIRLFASCRKELTRNMRLDLTHQFTKNYATFDLYSYTRNITTLGITYSF